MIINQIYSRMEQGLWRALCDLVMSPIQRLLAISLWNIFFNLLIAYSFNQTKLNLPFVSTYYNVSFTNFGPPNDSPFSYFSPPPSSSTRSLILHIYCTIIGNISYLQLRDRNRRMDPR